MEDTDAVERRRAGPPAAASRRRVPARFRGPAAVGCAVAAALVVSAWLRAGTVHDGAAAALPVGAPAALALAAVLAAVLLDGGGERASSRATRAPDERVPRADPGAADAVPPGLLFVEIGGLSEPVLRAAIERGHAPTLARWLRSGGHRLAGWECALPSEPGAGQAGILHGDNFDVPAFRWYDKPTRTVVVANRHQGGAATVEGRVSNGRGLLAAGGASRGTLLSGDAAHALFTCSTSGTRRRAAPGHDGAVTDPLGQARLAARFARDALVALGPSAELVLRAGRPSFREVAARAAARAFTTAVLPERCVRAVAADMTAGVPAVYLAFAGYDAAAHRSGVRSRAALRALRGIDRQVARLERAGLRAARPYRVVVLSGHGQSPGPTFRARHGRTLGRVVGDLVPDATVLVERDDPDETLGTVRTLLADPTADTWPARWTARLLDLACGAGGPPARPPDPPTRGPADPPRADALELLVLASGTLGLVSFPAWPHRLTHEELSARFPRLIPGLVGHGGIAFVLVTSARHGAMVIGATGTAYLDDDRIEGDDPLATFDPHAARHLRRLNLFATCPEILVHGRLDPATGEVVSFEETVGAHGGLGGPQSRPFVLHPSDLSLGPEPIGAPALHEAFARWRRELDPAAPAPPPPVARAGGRR